MRRATLLWTSIASRGILHLIVKLLITMLILSVIPSQEASLTTVVSGRSWNKLISISKIVFIIIARYIM